MAKNKPGSTAVKNYRFCRLLWLGLLISCSAVADPQLSQKYNAQPFQAINISGPIDVQIVSGQTRPTLQLLGDADGLAHVYAAVKDGTLYLSTQADYVPNENCHLVAKVNSTFLGLINYQGTGKVTATNLTGPINVVAKGNGTVTLLGKNLDLRNVQVAAANNVHILGIKSSLLNVQDDGSGKVNLAGTMVLQSVTYSGTGPLSIYWIDSSDVTVTGNGKGRIFLAGTAGNLDVNVAERTYLDAKYLRAKRAFVRTSDYARTDVWTQCSLSTLAMGSSNIYYYSDPALMVGSYAQPPAAVLRMTGIDNDHIPAPPKPC
jgi:hypothetical protein